MASKLSVLVVTLLVLSFVMLVTSIDNPIKESEASCVPNGVPCNSNDDCIGSCRLYGTCKPDGCCCIVR
ncbi:hypothetical protein BHE74_00028890 [Ensete ventricosum]|nr:hypothetical protein BHE74_00028890 [Ensete ventricosum]RZS14946.1 hypothetical protein BHM03_00046710 [Ensete ventricosum]